MKAAFLHCHALHLADFLHTLQVEETTHLTGFDFLGNIAALSLAGNNVAGYRQVELADFLVERHLPHEVVDIAVHFGITATAFALAGS